LAVTGESGALAAKECAGCGLLFVPHRAAQAYHNGACYDRAYNRAHPVARRGQRALPGESRVERAFAEWIETEAGRYVEAEVVRLATEDRAAGDRRGEINLYLALVRRSSRGLTKDRQGFRCNNSWRSLLARRIMARNVVLVGFFETRALRGRVG
jgi:hypothetical protein